MSRCPTRLLLAAALGLALAVPTATGHEGPPYAIVVDRPTGPVLLSAWADPDVGTGTFHVYLEPLDGRPLPQSCAVDVLVRPVDGRLAEAGARAEPIDLDPDRHHHLAEVAFDRVGDWRTRLLVDCGGAGGEAATVVEVTPPGQGPVFDFLLYLFPFAALGVLLVRALIVGRRTNSEAS